MKKGLKLFLVGCTYWILQSCGNQFTPIPIHKMSDMLLEMHLAESLSQQLPKDSNQTSYKNEDSLLVFNAEILKKYHISESTFKANIDWYKTQPEMLDSVYQNILSEIAILQSKENK